VIRFGRAHDIIPPEWVGNSSAYETARGISITNYCMYALNAVERSIRGKPAASLLDLVRRAHPREGSSSALGRGA
jgi:hypothetical protein